VVRVAGTWFDLAEKVSVVTSHPGFAVGFAAGEADFAGGGVNGLVHG